MALFLKSNELNTALEEIFETAQEYLILISPYIKLHDRFISSLKTKKDKPSLRIIIVFGKNREDYSKSIQYDDFKFFRDFPNIEIRFEERLHAKYYANENAALLTSMNLYNFSQNNNIEAGVLINRSGLLGSITSNIVSNVTGQDNLEQETAGYFTRVVDQADLLFKRTPKYESTLLGVSKRFTTSEIELDKLSVFFESRSNMERREIVSRNGLNDSGGTRTSSIQMGYCIRTGVNIPFNVKRPLCDEAMLNWQKFANVEYPEKYCHFSGELSNGSTTFARPILKKNWSRAKEAHSL